MPAIELTGFELAALFNEEVHNDQYYTLSEAGDHPYEVTDPMEFGRRFNELTDCGPLMVKSAFYAFNLEKELGFFERPNEHYTGLVAGYLELPTALVREMFEMELKKFAGESIESRDLGSAYFFTKIVLQNKIYETFIDWSREKVSMYGQGRRFRRGTKKPKGRKYHRAMENGNGGVIGMIN